MAGPIQAATSSASAEGREGREPRERRRQHASGEAAPSRVDRCHRVARRDHDRHAVGGGDRGGDAGRADDERIPGAAFAGRGVEHERRVHLAEPPDLDPRGQERRGEVATPLGSAAAQEENARTSLAEAPDERATARLGRQRELARDLAHDAILGRAVAIAAISSRAMSAWEPVIGLEVHVQLRRGPRCSAAARTASARRRTPSSARSAWAIPARCRC